VRKNKGGHPKLRAYLSNFWRGKNNELKILTVNKTDTRSGQPRRDKRKVRRLKEKSSQIGGLSRRPEGPEDEKEKKFREKTTLPVGSYAATRYGPQTN